VTPWPIRKLGELVDVLSGFAFDSAGFADIGEMPLVRIRDVVEGCTSTFYSGPFDPRYIVSDGDVLIGMDGEFNRARWRGGRALLNQRVCRVTVSSPELHDGYLFYFLPAALKKIEDLTPYVTVKHLSVKAVRDISIALPPRPEQRRIAEVLDRAEALRAKRRAALAQLDTLPQAIFLEMFGDPRPNPKGWPVSPLGELMIDGPQNGLYRPASDYGSGTPILRIDAFYDGAVTNLRTLKRVRASRDEIELYGLRPADIVVNRVNSMEYLGKSALIPDLSEPTIFESNMIRFGVDTTHAHPRYVVQFLQTPYIKGQIQNAAKHAVNQSSINQQDVKGFRVLVPPLSLQQEFARRVAAVEQLKSAHRRSLDKLDELFTSLQHRAFRGEL
jgi:type I restriction enzyme, S subunit